MPDCVFCKIVKGEIPSTKTYEDDAVLAFLTIQPRAPKHTLVIPKKHYRWFYEMPDELAGAVFNVAKKLSVKLKEETGMEFVRLSIVGTHVPHVHIHLLPTNIAEAPEV
jgi:histidine triad (HIT) family protein